MNDYLSVGHIYNNYKKKTKEELLMKITSIERTPNPNSMRVVFDVELPGMESFNYKKKDAEQAQEPAASILKLDGIEGIYHVMNFMAIEKSGDTEWETLIPEIEKAVQNN